MRRSGPAVECDRIATSLATNRSAAAKPFHGNAERNTHHRSGIAIAFRLDRRSDLIAQTLRRLFLVSQGSLELRRLVIPSPDRQRSREIVEATPGACGTRGFFMRHADRPRRCGNRDPESSLRLFLHRSEPGVLLAA